MSVLQLHQVSLTIESVEILRGVDLNIQQGECLALIGPNGAGKSSLFNVISGRTPCTAGEILFHDQSIRHLSGHQIARRGLSRSFQISQLFDDLSVFDHLRCALMWRSGIAHRFWRTLSQEFELNSRAEHYLQLLQLEDKRNSLAKTLSYAEQRMLEVGMAIAGEAACLLFDEPTAGMNRKEADRMIDLLRQIRQLHQTKSQLIIEHDMQVVFELADRIAVMEQGRIIACDTPEKIRLNPQVQAAYLPAMESL